MKKSDLKTGMWIVQRDNSKSIVLLGTKHGDIFIENNGKWGNLDNINNNLTDKYLHSGDIIQVLQPKFESFYCLAFVFGKCEIIWERKEITPVKIDDALIAYLQSKPIKSLFDDEIFSYEYSHEGKGIGCVSPEQIKGDWVILE